MLLRVTQLNSDKRGVAAGAALGAAIGAGVGALFFGYSMYTSRGRFVLPRNVEETDRDAKTTPHPHTRSAPKPTVTKPEIETSRLVVTSSRTPRYYFSLKIFLPFSVSMYC